MKHFFCTLIVLLMLVPNAAFGKDKGFSTVPVSNQGKKWRIGYYESGVSDIYHETLYSIVNSLSSMGWIKKQSIPVIRDKQKTKVLWQWLSTQIESDFIQFVGDAFYSANWDQTQRQSQKNAIIKRLTQSHDIDLMFAMGEWAGLDLANNDHQTPTLVLAVPDPIESGIVVSANDSGIDHIHARSDPTRYQRQINLFYDIIGFKKLGIACETFPHQVISEGMMDIMTVAKQRKFDVITCNYDINANHKDINEVIKCIDKLAQKVDAVYIIPCQGISLKNIQQIIAPLIKRKIPTFSHIGSQWVKHGVLFSVARSGYRYIGHFYAVTIAKILNGAKPRALTQIFEDPPKLAINLKTSEIISYNPSVAVLGAADEIFTDIQVVEMNTE